MTTDGPPPRDDPQAWAAWDIACYMAREDMATLAPFAVTDHWAGVTDEPLIFIENVTDSKGGVTKKEIPNLKMHDARHSIDTNPSYRQIIIEIQKEFYHARLVTSYNEDYITSQHGNRQGAIEAAEREHVKAVPKKHENAAEREAAQLEAEADVHNDKANRKRQKAADKRERENERQQKIQEKEDRIRQAIKDKHEEAERKGKRKLVLDKETGDVNCLKSAMDFIKHHHVVFEYDSTKTYVRNNNCYEYCDDKQLDSRITETYGEQDHKIVREIRKNVNANSPPINYSDFNKDPDVMYLADSVLDIDTGKTRPYQPTDYNKYKLNVQYDPTMKKSRTFKVLFDSLEHDITELRPLLEGMADAITNGYPALLTKFYILIGPQDSGKSTALHMLECLFYKGVAHNNMQAMTRDHGTENLPDARIVLDYDMSPRDIQEVSMIKKLVSSEGFMSNPKNIRIHNVDNYKLKLFFAMNELPDMPDDVGLYKRLHPITYNITFDGLPDMYKELNTPEERAALFNILLAVARQLRKTRQPMFVKTIDNVRAQLKEIKTGVGKFVDAVLDYGSGRIVTKADLKTAYESWCDNNGQKSLSENKFNAALRAINKDRGKGVREGQTRSHGRRLKCWHNVGFKQGDIQTMLTDKQPSQEPDGKSKDGNLTTPDGTTGGGTLDTIPCEVCHISYPSTQTECPTCHRSQP